MIPQVRSNDVGPYPATQLRIMAVHETPHQRSPRVARPLATQLTHGLAARD